MRFGLMAAGLTFAILACRERDRGSAPTTVPTKLPTVVNIIWFGHSLVQRTGSSPLDLPDLVRSLQRSARTAGRSKVPEGISQAYVREGRHLGHHLTDGASAKLAQHKHQNITHIVGIGFMHMLGQKSFDRPTVAQWLGRLLPSRYDSPRPHTEHIYQFIDLIRRELPSATWVNYVGPALATNPGPQASIDARFACIAEATRHAGVTVLNALVGTAFRNAEAAARRHTDFKLTLQEPDGLHLAPQGALLAASVLHASIYAVDPVGLAIPDSFAVHLGSTAEERERVVRFLQETARVTLAAPPLSCAEITRLPEDKGPESWHAP